jgi:DNA-binding transcriptional MerR regulator
VGYRLGEVCARTGLTPKQLRDWERHGLVRSMRGSGNQRTYELGDIERLARAKRMRDAGLSLAEIKYTLAVLDGSATGTETMAAAHVRTILARIRTQLDLADELTEAIRVRLLRRVHGGHP